MRTLRILSAAFLVAAAFAISVPNLSYASSHREAPTIANDPVADNTDLYMFRSPDDPTTITILANYIPFELPEGGPNYFSFGSNVRYEIHIKNKATGTTDDITYRFTFTNKDEDSTTFFNIRLGLQNIKTTFVCQKSTDGGSTWSQVATGNVPPANIGPRSITTAGVGLGKPYSQIMHDAIVNVPGAETIFCGPVDDPFFVDLAGIFDLGGFRAKGADGLAGFNCHTIALKIPIAMLQKDHKTVDMAANILDPDFVIGAWASASRPRITTLHADGTTPDYSTDYVQISRIGMPLTNEAIIPIGMKDKWNAASPYGGDAAFIPYFTNPELALYCGSGPFSAAVPGLAALRIDTNSLQGHYDFRNGSDGLYGLTGNAAVKGTALDASLFGPILLQPKAPRSVDILPIFYTGAPNLAPYQLATGKGGNPLANGKPFINNFLPTLGDMLRLNMAVPVTDRNSQEFKDHASEGLIRACAIGLTDPKYNNTNLEAIPEMDGFPNGRRLEDDVTTIEMQAVGGLVLNAIGLWTDDYLVGDPKGPVTDQLKAKLGWTAGVSANDVPLSQNFPFEAAPHQGSDGLKHPTSSVHYGGNGSGNNLNIAPPIGAFTGQNYPNPVSATGTTLNVHTTVSGLMTVKVYDLQGQPVATLLNERQPSGDFSAHWQPTSDIPNGNYFAVLYVDGEQAHQIKLTVQR